MHSNYYKDLIKFFGRDFVLIQKMQYLSDFGFRLYVLFPTFICANDTRSLVNSLFGVKILIPVPIFFIFQGINFALSAIVSSR